MKKPKLNNNANASKETFEQFADDIKLLQKLMPKRQLMSADLYEKQGAEYKYHVKLMFMDKLENVSWKDLHESIHGDD